MQTKEIDLIKQYKIETDKRMPAMLSRLKQYQQYAQIMMTSEQELVLTKYVKIKQELNEFEKITSKLEREKQQLQLELTKAQEIKSYTMVNLLTSIISGYEKDLTSVQKEKTLKETELSTEINGEQLKQQLLRNVTDYSSLFDKHVTFVEKNISIINKKIEQQPSEFAKLINDISNYVRTKSQYIPVSDLVNSLIDKCTYSSNLFYELKQNLVDYDNAFIVIEYYTKLINQYFDIELLQLFGQCFNNKRNPSIKDYENLLKLSKKILSSTETITQIETIINTYYKHKFKIFVTLNTEENLHFYNSIIQKYNLLIISQINNSLYHQIIDNELTTTFTEEVEKTKQNNLQFLENLKNLIIKMNEYSKELKKVKNQIKTDYSDLEKPLEFFDKFKGLNQIQIIEKLAEMNVSNEEIIRKDRINFTEWYEARKREVEIGKMVEIEPKLQSKLKIKGYATQKQLKTTQTW